MHSQLRRAHQPPMLGMVFLITMAILIMGCAFVLMGVAGLLDLDGVGVEPLLPSVGVPPNVAGH
jgi:hypothetical protein